VGRRLGSSAQQAWIKRTSSEIDARSEIDAGPEIDASSEIEVSETDPGSEIDIGSELEGLKIEGPEIDGTETDAGTDLLEDMSTEIFVGNAGRSARVVIAVTRSS